eukprot:6466216-Alexandrium_andersonii.AAC.1
MAWFRTPAPFVPIPAGPLPRGSPAFRSTMLPPVPWAARPPSGPCRPPLGPCLRRQRATAAPSP